jgi:hypothetical protein
MARVGLPSTLYLGGKMRITRGHRKNIRQNGATFSSPLA